MEMFARLKPRAALLGVALAALGAPALAATTVIEGYNGPPTYYVPATTTYYVPASNTYYVPSTTYYYEPAATYYVPRTTVIAPRASEDELINSEVADRILANPRINGTIGIETERNVVTLSGRVTTPGMAREAVREAQGVQGVRDVRHDYLRTRVGGSY
jgi:hypothetical protein